MSIQNCRYCEKEFELPDKIDDTKNPIMVRSVLKGDYICYACFKEKIIPELTKVKK